MLPDFRVRKRDYLLEISRSITEELDLNTVLARILRVSTELLAGHAGLIALREKKGSWYIAASYGIKTSFIRHLEALLSSIPNSEDAARSEVTEVSRRLEYFIQSASLGLPTYVGLPLIANQEVVGVIFVFRSYSSRFSSEDRALLESFASQAAIAVVNARLYTRIIHQNQYLDTILESSADGIFILDHSHRFERFNHACSRITGYQSEEVINHEYNEIIRWRKREPGIALEEAEAGGWPLKAQTTIYSEGDLIRKDGGTVSVGITYAPIISPKGILTSIVANLRDITKFREADELKSTFISVVSHELRTPVALIKGYVGTLRREDAQWDPETVNESLAVIEEEADRLSSLIDDLLEASRLQSGTPTLNLSEVNLENMVHRRVERIQTQTTKHIFSISFPKNFPIIIADGDRLTQVISNLLSNAVKYSPNGGKISINGQMHSDEVIICVSDEGPGIDPEDVPYIFDRFYRSKSIMKKISGAGLGLYLTKAIIEAHDGRIWIDERHKKGAHICFSLPRAPLQTVSNKRE